MRFLLTRPEPECTRSAEKLRELGHEVFQAPMLRMVEKPSPLFDLEGVSALAVTSARVADILVGHQQIDLLASLPVYAVGDRSAEVLQGAGFQDVISAQGNVADLARQIVSGHSGGQVLYLAAQDRAGDLEELLKTAQISCVLNELYQMEPVVDIDMDLLQILEVHCVDAVLIYSRRTAETLVARLEAVSRIDLLHGMRVVAISEGSAGPMPDEACVEIASHPTEMALFELALRRC
ncbi:uroporphyrinogen-III synthase [Roseibium algae]|uniref:Uroporphyrinogen-III synthase n=1 Tax=Roseibium algae TaxID=3123038 RepID=A0ABU8TNQ9_9HYPH